MICTKTIKAGEQIVNYLVEICTGNFTDIFWQWNTYGDLPNSELLRRYGHIDLLPDERGVLRNPADVVEIKGDLVVQAIGCEPDALKDRIEWWLGQGEDELSHFVRVFGAWNSEAQI